MFTTKIKSIFIAAAVTIGAVAASTSTANAEVRGGVYIGSSGFSIGIGDYEYRDRRGRSDRWDRRERRDRRSWNQCRPNKAVRKARRKGLRRAHVVRVGHRGVIVAGRKWGERVVMSFRGDRRCSVRFVRGR